MCKVRLSVSWFPQVYTHSNSTAISSGGYPHKGLWSGRTAIGGGGGHRFKPDEYFTQKAPLRNKVSLAASARVWATHCAVSIRSRLAFVPPDVAATRSLVEGQACWGRILLNWDSSAPAAAVLGDLGWQSMIAEISSNHDRFRYPVPALGREL